MYSRIIRDNQALLENITIIPRDYELYDDLLQLHKIVSFIGPRRVGKTFLMLSFVQQLIKAGKIVREQVVFIDFSLHTGETIDPNALLMEYKALYPDQEPFFIFDELQEIVNFKHFVLTLYSMGYQIFISGSNATLLSQELSTHFRGRVFEYKVFPLTCKELIRFHDSNVSLEKHTSAQLSTIQHANFLHLLEEALRYGTFPEIVLSNHELFKKDLLKTYYEIVVYKDLLERYKIDNEYALQYLLKSITNAYTKNININKIYNELKSKNIKIGKTTLYEYYGYLQNIFFMHELLNFYKPKGTKKGYLYNIGFNRLLGGKENKGQSFENLIFLELLKVYQTVTYKRNGNEIDFYIPEHNLTIQVCYALTNENFSREIAPLLKNTEGTTLLIYAYNNTTQGVPEHIMILDFWSFLQYIYS